MIQKRTKLPQFIIAILLLAFFSFSANAAKAITISPLNFELNTNPGDNIANVIRVYNDTNSEISVKMDVQDFTVAGERGEVLIKTENDNSVYSLQNWVSLDPEVFSLAPHSTQTVGFAIKVPGGAEPGGHYASILASVSGAGLESTGVGVAQKVGSLLLLSVAGEVVEKIEIAEFSAPEFTEYGPKELTVRFSNSGTVHLKPSGFIYIKNMLGQEVAKINLPQMNVLPQSTRNIAIPVDLKNQIGKYEATLVAIYGSANEPLSAETEYWVAPWKEMSVVLAVIIIIIIIIFLSRKRLKLAARVLFKGEGQAMKKDLSKG